MTTQMQKALMLMAGATQLKRGGKPKNKVWVAGQDTKPVEESGSNNKP